MRLIKKSYTYVLGMMIALTSFQSIGYDTLFNIYGGIGHTTCRLKSSPTQNVSLGEVTMGDGGFGLRAGSYSDYVYWDIVFYCPQDVGVMADFNGEYVRYYRAVLVLNNVPGAAQGFGVETQLFVPNKNKWESIDISSKRDVISRADRDTETTLQFRSFYRQTSDDASSGIGNSTLEIEFTYY